MTAQIASTKNPHSIRNAFSSIAFGALLMGGISLLGYAGAIVALSHIHQATEEKQFENVVLSPPPLALSTPPPVAASAPRPVEAGKSAAVAVLEIPRLGLKAIVDEGVTDNVLRQAVGHIPQTALPGESGNVVLAGHRDTFFRPLKKIEPGDPITLKTPRGKAEYRVEQIVVVAPSDVRLLKQTDDATLTLVTCYPFQYIGPAPKRFIVRARLISPPLAESN
jgi:sortase A